MMRHRFAIDTDTGTAGDTGAPFHGLVLQAHWVPSTGDTGADLLITMPVAEGDTGGAVSILDDNDSLGSTTTWTPRHSDTGSPPFVAAGERLRVKVTPGGTAVVGTLYVWTGE